METGEYEIVEVTQGHLESTGPEGSVAGDYTTIAIRPAGILSRYRVFVDVENETVVGRVWEYVKEPPPCVYSEPPLEFFTLEEAARAPSTACPFAVPEYIPPAYTLLKVRIFGDPCPSRQTIFTNTTGQLLLVQTCSGDPPYPFAISMPETRSITVNGHPGEYVEGIGQNQISWSDENASFWLRGSLPEDELAAVASSVRPFGDHPSAPQEG